MPLINECISFNAEQTSLIASITSRDDFHHTIWSDEALQELRSCTRQFYRRQQRCICAYCKEQVSLVYPANAHIEHIAPKSLYPNFMFEPKNLCVVCVDCNSIKRNQEVLESVPDTVVNGETRQRYPSASTAFKIVHPHIDDYDSHIVKKGRLYCDLTPKGNFTIGACKLNRFLHEFHDDTSLVDNPQLSGLMEDFLNSDSDLEKTRSINSLMEIFFNL
ncbi:TPA: hypothetical protein NGU23_004665 [Vibrio parahaemolyticus]|nr:hypothetical protein [Vibrio parahaemolyticus]